MKIRTPNAKYHFMIGTTSRVPGSSRLHYLIFDIDNKWNMIPAEFNHIDPDTRFQETENGWHIYTGVKMYLKEMLNVSVAMGSDRTWAGLALNRGWAFLADKSPIILPWPVDRKIIGWKKP